METVQIQIRWKNQFSDGPGTVFQVGLIYNESKKAYRKSGGFSVIRCSGWGRKLRCGSEKPKSGLYGVSKTLLRLQGVF